MPATFTYHGGVATGAWGTGEWGSCYGGTPSFTFHGQIAWTFSGTASFTYR